MDYTQHPFCVGLAFEAFASHIVCDDWNFGKEVQGLRTSRAHWEQSDLEFKLITADSKHEFENLEFNADSFDAETTGPLAAMFVAAPIEAYLSDAGFMSQSDFLSVTHAAFRRLVIACETWEKMRRYRPSLDFRSFHDLTCLSKEFEVSLPFLQVVVDGLKKRQLPKFRKFVANAAKMHEEIEATIEHVIRVREAIETLSDNGLESCKAHILSLQIEAEEFHARAPPDLPAMIQRFRAAA